jgi:aspartate kinase
VSLVVQKYGGTSVGSLDHIRNVARHVGDTVAQGHALIVTISAMGEQTDDLLAMATKLNPRPPRRELDMLLTAGERISAALLAIALDERKVKSVSLTGSQVGILTDETHGNARITRITGERVRDSLANGRVVIVAGFQGVSPRTKEITTLGRGGTDLSAIALAVALGADRCQLYKDVRGLYTADPRTVGNARLLETLSFEGMTALAWAGSPVLHPRGAHLAAKYGVPFEIRSSLELDHPGTLIQRSDDVESPKIQALAQKTPVTLVTTRVAGAAAQPLIAEALDWLWQQGESPLTSGQSLDEAGTTLTQVVKSSLVGDYLEALAQAAATRGAKCETVRRTDGLAAVTVVGQGFQQSPETVARIFGALQAPPTLVATSNTVITVCVKESALKDALVDLHRALFE